MRKSLLFVAAAAAMSFGVVSAQADALLYSFETGDAAGPLDGFAHNGGGITVTQDTIGATNGSNSMKLVTGVANGFVGALTSNIPAALDDPAVGSISFDLTTTAPQYAGSFADIGITIFVENVGLGEFGEQFQTDFVPSDNIDLAAGTYTLTHPLFGPDPDSGIPETFAQLLGNGFTPTGFEFFISKDGSAAATAYVDNVRTVNVPEPASIGALAGVGAMMLGRRRRKI